MGEEFTSFPTKAISASPMVTLNVYADLMRPTNPEAACRLENSVFEAVKN